MTSPDDRSWVERTDHVLRPDVSRVVSGLFLIGQETEAGESRSALVFERVMALSDSQVDAEVDRLAEAFGERHRHLSATWERNVALVAHRLGDLHSLPDSRRQLIGGYFTQEYAIEGAALFNPSMVAHPDQGGLAEGTTRFLMTIRAVGEGHISSIEFRTGTVDAANGIVFDPLPMTAVLAQPVPASFSLTSFRNQLREFAGDRTNIDFVLEQLPEAFTQHDLDGALEDLYDQRLTRGHDEHSRDALQDIAGGTYAMQFATDSSLQERVLMPMAPAESNGMEDARMTRFQDDQDPTQYFGTYTAYNGRNVTTQLMQTDDFLSFTFSGLSGPGARNKGLAIFPRRVGGQYLALSRADRECNGVTSSTDLHHWERRVVVQEPREPWEIVQLGNCGPPIETDRGWIVLTHGVGAMREYSMGAILLDLDDPTILRGRLAQPLLTADAGERSGYVPNVVYSCGAMRHGGTLVLPYGCSDAHTRLALVDIESLLDALLDGASPSH